MVRYKADRDSIERLLQKRDWYISFCIRDMATSGAKNQNLEEVGPIELGPVPTAFRSSASCKRVPG